MKISMHSVMFASEAHCGAAVATNVGKTRQVWLHRINQHAGGRRIFLRNLAKNVCIFEVPYFFIFCPEGDLLVGDNLRSLPRSQWASCGVNTHVCVSVL